MRSAAARMANMKIVVLDGYCLNPGDLSWSAFERFGTVDVYDRSSAHELIPRARDAGIILTNKTPLPGEILRELRAARYVGVLATGYNMVDTATARELGITVTNIPSYGTASVAQFVFALLLELCCRVALHADAVRAGEWSRSPDWSFTKAPLLELAGKTMGIVGFGRIGRQTARIADALGMRIVATSTSPTDPPPYPGFRFTSLEDLLRQSDVISLHVPLSEANRGMINTGTLMFMKPTALLINTSRGALIVDQDLAHALNASRIAGAAMDVLSDEPPAHGNPLLGAKNCIVTPHIAWATKEARSRLMDAAVSNLAAFLDGKASNVVM